MADQLPLGELVKITTGRKDANFGGPTGKYPFFTCARSHIYADSYSFDTEALLIAGNGDVGHTQYYNGKFEAYQRTYVLSDFAGKIRPKFLMYALKNGLKQHLINRTHGSTMPYIRIGDLQSFLILVPSLSNQDQSLVRLEKAESVLSLRDQSQSELDNYLRSLFIEMFGDPATNPKNWAKKKFKSVAEITTGNTPSRANSNYYGNYIEWIKSDNLNTPYHYATKATEYLSEQGAKVGRVVPPKSILVTCIAGSKECIGNAAIVDRRVAFNQQINSITCGSELVPEFVYTFVLVGKKIIQSASTNSMKGMVSKGNFEEIEIYVPPKDLQTDFAKRFSLSNALKAKMEESKIEMHNMFSSTLSEAFAGNQ